MPLLKLGKIPEQNLSIHCVNGVWSVWRRLSCILINWRLFRAKSGCEFSSTLFWRQLLNGYLGSRWGASMGHSWRVSFLLLFPIQWECIDIQLSIRQRAILDPSGTLLPPSSTCMLVLVFIDNNSLFLFNVYSNSFITQATDFYGRNDLDMVRLSFLYFT